MSPCSFQNLLPGCHKYETLWMASGGNLAVYQLIDYIYFRSPTCQQGLIKCVSCLYACVVSLVRPFMILKQRAFFFFSSPERVCLCSVFCPHVPARQSTKTTEQNEFKCIYFYLGHKWISSGYTERGVKIWNRNTKYSWIQPKKKLVPWARVFRTHPDGLIMQYSRPSWSVNLEYAEYIEIGKHVKWDKLYRGEAGQLVPGHWKVMQRDSSVAFSFMPLPFFTRQLEERLYANP